MEIPQTHQEVRSTNVVRINEEIKNRFSQSAKSMIATAQNNMIIQVNPGSSNAISVPVTETEDDREHKKPSSDLNKINFNKALFKKNIVTSAVNAQSGQQTENNSVLDPLEHSTGSASLTMNDAFLSDDLAQLQIIDDKSLVNALRMKFEMKKYYVTF